MIATSQRKPGEANKMREGLLKSQIDLGRKRKNKNGSLFSKMKKN